MGLDKWRGCAEAKQDTAIVQEQARIPIPNIPDKLRHACSVLRWGITREPQVLYLFCRGPASYTCPLVQLYT